MAQMINVLLTSFAGLGLPSTLSLPVPASTSVSTLSSIVHERLPCACNRLILTTNSNKQLDHSSSAPISSLLPVSDDDFLPLRLSLPLCGGKGGFGSQLRAAGGRMSSRRKKNQGEDNGSNRNLDGRRLRTVTEAKALAEYLALKPEMDKKEKEERRKRWEAVVEMAERREQEMRNTSRGRVDGKWMEDKEEAGERTREAVLAAIKSGDFRDNLLSTSNGSSSMDSAEPMESSEDEGQNHSSSKETTPSSDSKPTPSAGINLFGFDEDDEFLSDEEGEEDGGVSLEEEVPVVDKGKTKV